MNTILVIAIVVLCLATGALAVAAVLLRRDVARLHREKAEALEACARAEAEARTRFEERMRVETTLAAERERAAAERERTAAEIEALRSRSAEERAAEQAEREKSEERLRLQFQNLANEVLGEQSRRFKETNKESLDLLLKPFKENIAEFRERVERIYSHENEERGALHNELKNLMELNRRITTETTNLTNALKGNSKVQGDWGEVILETILDSSNLIRGVHYQTQLNIKDEAGNNRRPDVVLRLPEGKCIVIDSKVSLTAFVNYTSAESEAERARHLAAHLASVRQHVTELGRKEYQRLVCREVQPPVESPDFVIMFIPNEPAFLTALQNDPTIWADAYEKKVIISSPTNLFALLKLVDDLWKRNAQSRNTADIVTYGTKLYDQLVAFTTSLEGVGAALGKAREAYDDAYKRLHTGNDNIVRTGERLRRLGLPTKRRQSARTLEAAGATDEEQPADEELRTLPDEASHADPAQRG